MTKGDPFPDEPAFAPKHVQAFTIGKRNDTVGNQTSPDTEYVSIRVFISCKKKKKERISLMAP